MNIAVKCDGCGQAFERGHSEYARSQKLGRSSFCSRTCLAKNRDNSVYKHCGDASYLTPSNRRDALTPFRWYMRTIRYRCQYAKTRLKQTDLTIHDLVEQWEKQKGICPYTGWHLVLPHGTIGWKDGCQPDCASVDRINSSLGCVKGKGVFVSVMYNHAKNAFSDEQVMRFCHAVAAQNSHT